VNLDTVVLLLKDRPRIPRAPAGWTAWLGGPNPAPNKRVRYKMRAGNYEHPGTANTLRWEHLNGASDIIAYKVVE
jgi:hypothetical protein